MNHSLNNFLDKLAELLFLILVCKVNIKLKTVFVIFFAQNISHKRITTNT